MLAKNKKNRRKDEWQYFSPRENTALQKYFLVFFFLIVIEWCQISEYAKCHSYLILIIEKKIRKVSRADNSVKSNYFSYYAT